MKRFLKAVRLVQSRTGLHCWHHISNLAWHSTPRTLLSDDDNHHESSQVRLLRLRICPYPRRLWSKRVVGDKGHIAARVIAASPTSTSLSPAVSPVVTNDLKTHSGSGSSLNQSLCPASSILALYSIVSSANTVPIRVCVRQHLVIPHHSQTATAFPPHQPDVTLSRPHQAALSTN